MDESGKDYADYRRYLAAIEEVKNIKKSLKGTVFEKLIKADGVQKKPIAGGVKKEKKTQEKASVEKRKALK